MSDLQVHTLKLNSEFQFLVHPHSLSETLEIENTLRNQGCTAHLKVWNGTLLYHYEHYEICTRYNIPFRIEKLKVKHYEEAVAWLCKKQLERTDLPEEMRKYLVGKRYLMEKVLGAHKYANIKQTNRRKGRNLIVTDESRPYDETATQTRERLGAEYHMSHATVRKYGIFAQNIDVIRESCPEFVRQVLIGKVRIAHEHLDAIVHLPPSEIKIATESFLSDDSGKKSYSHAREILSKNSVSIETKATRGPRPLIPASLPSTTGAIKNMPEYDPDAEISSLTYTVPSWVSSINRVRNVSDLSKVSGIAKSRLKKELINLKVTVDIMLNAMKE